MGGAAPAVAGAAAWLCARRVPPAHFADPPAAPSLRWLLRDRFMWTLAGLVFVGMGVYNAVATWLEPILHRFTPDAPPGALVALMTFAGVLAAAPLPPLVAAPAPRRPR